MVAKLFALVLPLGLDTFAVAAALGAAGAAAGDRLRISLLLSAFEAGMPLIGLAIGAPLARLLGGAADYVAIGVLVALAVHLLFSDEGDRQPAALLGRGAFAAVALGVSVSLDELAIGFTLGLLRLPVAVVVILIALQAFALAQVGLRLGGRLNTALAESAERLAGLALAALGAVLLAEKLLA